MRDKRENLILAILWLIVLIIHIIKIIAGTFNPTVFNVLMPLVLLVVEYWMEYLDSYWGD